MQSKTPADRTWKYRVHQQGSTAVESLEAAFDLLREIYPSVPPAVTSWPESEVPEKYKRIVALLRADLPAGMGSPRPRKGKAKPLPPLGHTLLVCACKQQNRTVYVKRSVLDAGGIHCAFCRQEFRRITSHDAS